MIVRPYIKYDGIPTFRDSEIDNLFDLMLRDGCVDTVFYTGNVKNAFDFRDLMNESLLFVALDNTNNDTPLGVGWINGKESCTARAHFCVFKEGRDMGAVIVGKALLDKTFSFCGLEMLIGYVPETNRPAIRFAQKCGAEVLGYFPTGSYIDREMKRVGTAVLYYLRSDNNG